MTAPDPRLRAAPTLREAVVEALDWFDKADREQNVHQYRKGLEVLRAALSAPVAAGEGLERLIERARAVSRAFHAPGSSYGEFITFLARPVDDMERTIRAIERLASPPARPDAVNARAVRAALSAAPVAAGEGLRELLNEAVRAYHQLDSLRNHSDDERKDGWYLAPFERCNDLLCKDARDALASPPAPPDAD